MNLILVTKSVSHKKETENKRSDIFQNLQDLLDVTFASEDIQSVKAD